VSWSSQAWSSAGEVGLTRIREFARRLHKLHRLGDDDAIDREFSAVCRAIWGFTLDDFTDDDLSWGRPPYSISDERSLNVLCLATGRGRQQARWLTAGHHAPAGPGRPSKGKRRPLRPDHDQGGWQRGIRLPVSRISSGSVETEFRSRYVYFPPCGG
jgi:hypothetical protein